jgi:hypothetical protein
VRTREGATMKKLASVLVLLALTEIGRAGEEDILKRLRERHVNVSDGPDQERSGKQVVGLSFVNPDIPLDLAELCELQRLQSLAMVGQVVTAADMRTISGLTGLRYLILTCCPVTDAQMKHVGKLRRLQYLDLGFTTVTDAGLMELTGLKDLKIIYLTFTNVSTEGVARFQKALPDCKIFR